eukprot:CAMPEP_0173323332 /NCGR_PEP_ID=MMETSP1143-20121109/30468_1 /TAXON_ID=483371 /ORGANISM="non described non described, Strain CCMP2298" /LENGTH=57 /DNA_ID=CAMNT_0014267305 /DNA_START=83 /DNA_END=252 /DNA_ORIENTATION=-
MVYQEEIDRGAEGRGSGDRGWRGSQMRFYACACACAPKPVPMHVPKTLPFSARSLRS